MLLGLPLVSKELATLRKEFGEDLSDKWLLCVAATYECPVGGLMKRLVDYGSLYLPMLVQPMAGPVQDCATAFQTANAKSARLPFDPV